jgi:hypothetical protein
MGYKVDAHDNGQNNWTVDITANINDSDRLFIYPVTATSSKDAEIKGLAKLKVELEALVQALP